MRILICDDHAVFTDSLAVVLAGAGHRVVGATYSPDDALAVLRRGHVDVCLMDLHFPSGDVVGRLAELRAAAPATRFVVVSGSTDEETIGAALRAGVRGFVSKGQPAAELIALLGRVHAGEQVVDHRLVRRLGRQRPRTQAHRVAQFLTPREREVLTRLARGESTAALAKAMGVTRSTARSHVQSVLTKLGVHSQREAVIEAARYGLVSVETGEWLVS
ncbi:MAG TPA: response regulator transcription factor [Streptosporangiaceae bacterium]